MFDFARAVNKGAGYAQSLAVTHIDAGGTVHLAGVAVDASASNGPGAQGHGIGASANAALIFDHATKLTVDGTAGVFAFGRNAGASGVKAHGVIDFGNAQTINVGGVGIGVFARNLATGDNGSGAKASAVLVQTNAAVHMNIGGSGLNLIALASSQGRDGASANALVDIDQSGISITGDILVSAKAVGGRNVARQSKAHANLTLDGGTGGVVLGGNVNVTAQASSNGIHGALASGLVSLTADRNVVVGGDLAIAAVASSHAAGNGALSPGVKANAHLSVQAGGSAAFRNGVAIAAQEKGNRTLAGSAIADGVIHANGNVSFADDLLVQANALGGLAAANVAALASLDLAAGKTLNLVKKADLTVNAHAVSSGTKAVTAVAYAHLQGNAIHEAVANGQGNVAITASALGLGHNIDDAIAVASFTADADVGGILFQHNIDVHAKAIDPGTGRMTALGYAAIDANNGVTVDGNISLSGDLTGNGLVAGSLDLAHVVRLYQRFGSASLHVDAQHGDVSLGGVSALATTKLTATGTPQAGNGIGSLGTAGAWADVHINAVTGDVTLDGPVHVGANATDAGHGGSPIARAHLDASAGGNLAASSVTINAQVAAPNAHNAYALALGEFSASGNQLTIAGHVGMNALVNAGAGASGNVGAVTDLVTNAHGGKVAIANGLAMNANAVDLSSSGAALAYANADIQGAAGVTVTGQTAITADLTTKTHGGGQVDIDIGDNDKQTMNYGWASAGLTIDPQADIKTGAITVDADADLLATAGPYSGGARALLNMNAADGAVAIGGPLAVTADVVSEGKFGGNASGIASALIHGKEGVTLGNATVIGSASAQGGGLGQNAHALGALKVKAETGNITAKSLTVVADAIHDSSGGHGVVTAKALSSLDAVTGNVTITGDKTLALAQGPHALSHATASADIVLHAGHDLAVTGGGLLAQAEALASFAQAPDKAGALIDVTAGSDIFLGGNVTALAVAIGSHSGQNATANIFAHAGTGGFGHLALIGNLSAIASADPVNDHALASVTLIANQMLIIGANPVASAIAGGKSAFRKAHRTTGSRRNGPSGTTAIARITINTDPGGLIVINDSSTGVIPSFSNPNADALQAMPIYDQTFPSGSLMAIPLSVDGQPCGALGGPGAAKGAAACRQAPINISNVVDGP